MILEVVEGHWTIEMSFDPGVSKNLRPSQTHWLSRMAPIGFLPIQRDDLSRTMYAAPLTVRGIELIRTYSVRHRAHLVDVSLSHPAPAYLDEEYPIIVSVTNIDDHDLNIVVDVLLHPAEDDTGMFYYALYFDVS